MQVRVEKVRRRLSPGRHSGLVALLSVLVLLAACTPTAPVAPASSGSTGAAAADEPITIKLMCWSGMIAVNELVVSDLIPAFEAQNPNIRVEYEGLPWGDYWTKIGTLAASGGMPDVYCNSVAYLWDHANKNMSSNIQEYFDRDLNPDDYFMELTAVERYPDEQGDLYGFPIRWVDGALYYNKNLFDAAGLSYPDDTWTYDDVLEAAKQLTKDTDGDGKVDQWGMLAKVDHVVLDSLIKSNGGQVLDDDYSTCMLTEPEALQAIQWMTDLVLLHEVSPSPSVAQGFVEGIFPSGKVAMEINGSYMTARWHTIEDFDWDVTYQPLGTAGRVVYGGPDSLSISKKSPYQEEAWKFIKFILSKDIQSRGDYVGLGSLPILKEAAYSDSWMLAAGQPGNAKVFADSESMIQGADFGSQWIEWRATIMNSELEQALLGLRSVEESAEAACKAINDVLAGIQRP